MLMLLPIMVSTWQRGKGLRPLKGQESADAGFKLHAFPCFQFTNPEHHVTPKFFMNLENPLCLLMGALIDGFLVKWCV